MLLGNRVAESLCRIRQPYHVYLSIDGGNEQAHDSNRGKDSFRRAVRGGHCLLRHRGESAWPHVSLYQLDLGVDEATYDAELLNLAAQCDVWQRVTPIVANEIGRAHVLTPVTNAHIVCRILLDKTKTARDKEYEQSTKPNGNM